MADKGNGGKGAQLVVVAGAAGVIGGLLGALFASRPVKAAPETDKLEYIATLLEQLNTTDAELLEAIKALSLGGVVTPGEIAVTVLTPWVAKDPEIIFQQAVRNAGAMFSDHMVDFRNAKRMVIKAESSLDQNVLIQVLGNISNTPNLATDLGIPIACPANGNADVGIGTNDDWRPYFGIRITVGVAPTTGMLTVWAVVQE